MKIHKALNFFRKYGQIKKNLNLKNNFEKLYFFFELWYRQGIGQVDTFAPTKRTEPVHEFFDKLECPEHSFTAVSKLLIHYTFATSG